MNTETLGVKANTLATNVEDLKCFHIEFERGHHEIFTRYFPDWKTALEQSLECAELNGYSLHQLTNEY